MLFYKNLIISKHWFFSPTKKTNNKIKQLRLFTVSVKIYESASKGRLALGFYIILEGRLKQNMEEAVVIFFPLNTKMNTSVDKV